MKFLYVALTLFATTLCGSIQSHLAPCRNKPPEIGQQIEGIDYIYMINLDKRPERLEKGRSELARYGLRAYRLAAIDGYKLSVETIRDIALPYRPGMLFHRWATTVENSGRLGYLFLKETTPPTPLLSEWMSPGALGCALSHLSILQDAYDSGYNTIWIVEDDIQVKQDPHGFTELLKKLDRASAGAWDILYTDPTDLDLDSIHVDKFWWLWRPDQALYDTHHFGDRQALTQDFIATGCHTRTHSMIIRRSGMEKILNHVKEHHLYLPIDHEIAFSKGIRLYATSKEWVTYSDEASDIKKQQSAAIDYEKTAWGAYKEQELKKLSEFVGWCTPTKANHLMNFLYQHRPGVCVEIGAFGGSTTFPLVSTLKYLQEGKLFAIDAWNNEAMIAGMHPYEPNYRWWKELDFEAFYRHFLYLIDKMQLGDRCQTVRLRSQEAACYFGDETVDLLYIDGNGSERGSLLDVVSYFPKVKPGGYIWLNEAATLEKLPSVIYLMQHADWLKEDSLENQCIVFQKKKKELTSH